MSCVTINAVSSKIFNVNGDAKRPYVKANINGYGRNFLYDTGAARTCMTLATFKNAFPHGTPRKLQTNAISDELYDASGGSLGCIGVYEIEFKILGKKFKHPVRVLKHVTEDIIGIDLINQHYLMYDPVEREVFFNRTNDRATLSLMKETHLPALSKVILKARFNGEIKDGSIHIATIKSDDSNLITGGPALIKIEKMNICHIEVANCAPYDMTLTRGSTIAAVEQAWEDELQEFSGKIIDNFIHEIRTKNTAPTVKKLTRQEIEERVKMNIPAQHKKEYLDLLEKYSSVISRDKSDLGMAKDFFHRIVLKDDAPVYRKQYQIPEAHSQFIEETLQEWLKLGVVRQTQSMYNSPIFCVPKKTGQGLRIVQDFRELNNHSHIDKYSMKEINECIGDIGRANSTIFSTLDLTSGFWQMPLHPDDAHKTAFTIPGRGQYEWVTSPMGLLGCPASFQRMMEKFMKNIPNVLVYIDDLLLHSKTHTEHLKTLEQVLKRLNENHMKLNIEKCFFGNTEVSYLGFVLTPEGIAPGKDKLKAIRNAKPPTDIKGVRSFVGLCNFFRTHIKNFAIISAPLHKLTRNDSGYKGGPLPPAAADAFKELQLRLVTNPVVAYPRSDRQYVLITDASTGTDKVAGGLGAILTQLDDKGRYHVISYGSRQLKDHEANYSPYLAEMAAANWGMEYFDNYLRGKQFIIYTDHKPLEKLSHLHTKTLNRLQENMLNYDFTIQYKKGATLPADFLSREYVDSLNETTASIDPFTPDLKTLQKQDEDLIKINHFQKHQQWPLNTTKSEIRTLLPLTANIFLDQNAVWIRLMDEDYPRTALWLPKIYRKRAMCEAHGQILSGHDALKKTYLRLTNVYFWPNMKKDIQAHIDSCLQCQLRKKSTAKQIPLQPLPTTDQPNQRIHIDLFGPLKTSGQGNKMVLVMTDAFTKYAEVLAIPDKQAETVAMEIFIHWICRFGTPVQIHSDNGTEFVNKLSKELFSLLQIKHTTTTPGHPQCNAQAEVFNKTMAKYLASFVDNSTLDWEQYLPALRFAYNTSYHSTIATTPFELLYGMKARTPSLPGQDVQRKFYGESFASERLQILQKAREIAKEHMDAKQGEYKFQHDKKSQPHDFSIGQQVWYAQTDFLGKNRKLAPKWLGPALLIEVNESVGKIKLSNNKTKTLNVRKLKHFFPRDQASDSDADSTHEDDDATSQPDADDLINFDPAPTDRPHTRAWTKLINKNGVSVLFDQEDAKQDAAFQNKIWYKLNGIAYKLYHLHLDFNQLTTEELKFWRSFDQEDIFEWLTGSPIHPPDYNEYIRITSRAEQHDQQPQPDQPDEHNQVPQPQPPQPGPGPSPGKRGRPLGSKNKPKDPFTRAAHYASKRITRATSKLLSPPTNKRSTQDST